MASKFNLDAIKNTILSIIKDNDIEDFMIICSEKILEEISDVISLDQVEGFNHIVKFGYFLLDNNKRVRLMISNINKANLIYVLPTDNMNKISPFDLSDYLNTDA